MLNFEFGTMVSGKTQNLIEDYITVVNDGKHALIWNSELDSRHEGYVSSRNGELDDVQALLYKSTTNLFNKFFVEMAKRGWTISNSKSGKHTFLFVDEAQFLTGQQVDQLSFIADFEDVTVNCYGLRTDFNGKLFEGSKRLFEVADNSFETKETYCRRCKTRSAIFNARFCNEELCSGEDNQIMIDDDDKVDYVPLCRACYRTIKENYNENDNN